MDPNIKCGWLFFLLKLICEKYPKWFTYDIWTKIKNEAIPEQTLYSPERRCCLTTYHVDVFPRVEMYRRSDVPFRTRRGKYMLHGYLNAIPIMQSTVNGASHLLFLVQRCLCHKEATQSLWEQQAQNLRGFVAQITRAAPIWALQHNCLFSKQKIPCSANRFWFRPSALWAGNPVEIKRELVNYTTALYAEL